MAHLKERITKEILHIAKENDGKLVGIASHGAAIRTFLCSAYGYELSHINKLGWSDNTAISEVEIEDGEIRVLFSSDASHLGDLCAKKQRWQEA